jgi:hypothetical protein
VLRFLVIILKPIETEHSRLLPTHLELPCEHSFILLHHHFQNAAEDLLILNVICINCCKVLCKLGMWSCAFDHVLEKCALLSAVYYYYYYYIISVDIDVCD